MSKKYNKRNVSQSEPTPATAAPSVSRRTSSGTAAASGEFNPDYSYVVKDLKRIGVLAGSFIVILVALSFFLN